MLDVKRVSELIEEGKFTAATRMLEEAKAVNTDTFTQESILILGSKIVQGLQNEGLIKEGDNLLLQEDGLNALEIFRSIHLNKLSPIFQKQIAAERIGQIQTMLQEKVNMQKQTQGGRKISEMMEGEQVLEDNQEVTKFTEIPLEEQPEHVVDEKIKKEARESAEQKGLNIEGPFMVEREKILGPYPWKEGHEWVSALMSYGKMIGLARSMKEYGQQDPIHLVEVEDSPGKYYILCGHNRFRAALRVPVLEHAMKAWIVSGFENYDQMVDYAIDNNIRDKGVSVVWDNQLKQMIDQGLIDEDTVSKIRKDLREDINWRLSQAHLARGLSYRRRKPPQGWHKIKTTDREKYESYKKDVEDLCAEYGVRSTDPLREDELLLEALENNKYLVQKKLREKGVATTMKELGLRTHGTKAKTIGQDSKTFYAVMDDKEDERFFSGDHVITWLNDLIKNLPEDYSRVEVKVKFKNKEREAIK